VIGYFELGPTLYEGQNVIAFRARSRAGYASNLILKILKTGITLQTVLNEIFPVADSLTNNPASYIPEPPLCPVKNSAVIQFEIGDRKAGSLTRVEVSVKSAAVSLGARVAGVNVAWVLIAGRSIKICHFFSFSQNI